MARVRTARTPGELQAQFRDIAERAAALRRRFDAAAFAARPRPDGWSAAECLAHLNISADPYFPMWRDAVARSAGTTQPPREAPRLDFWGWVLVWTLEPPPRFRFPTTPPFQPVDAGSIDVVLPAFLERQARILDALDQLRGAALDAVKVTSPFERRVRYSIWSSFCVIAAHERRHLWQAERALQQVTGHE
ncbi:MAG TPA: DinB family protein [Vicinamibacterales bacterium]